jgi:hypothetical protein
VASKSTGLIHIFWAKTLIGTFSQTGKSTRVASTDARCHRAGRRAGATCSRGWAIVAAAAATAAACGAGRQGVASRRLPADASYSWRRGDRGGSGLHQVGRAPRAPHTSTLGIQNRLSSQKVRSGLSRTVPGNSA